MDDPFKEETLNEIWWQQEENSIEATRAIVSTMKSLQQANVRRRDDFWFYSELYGDDGFETDHLVREDFKYSNFRKSLDDSIGQYYLVKEVVDTIQSVVCSSKPKTQYMTDGSVWKQRSLARKINKFNEGIRISQGVQGKMFTEYKKSLLFGNGILKFVPDGKYVGIETVLPYEILIDSQDALYGKPRTFIQARAMMRTAAKKAFMPEKKEDQEEFVALVDSLPSPDPNEYKWITHGRPGTIIIVEGWHCEDDKKGRHLLCFEDGRPLDDGVWKDKEPPFAFGWYSKPMIGFWGPTVSKVLAPKQIECSRLQDRNFKNNKYFGMLKMHISEGSSIEPEQLTNGEALVFKSTGDPPTVIVDPSTNHEYNEAIDKYRVRAFAHFGLDTAFSTGVKPAGLESGEAIRQYVDHASMRLNPGSDQWDAFSVEIDKNIIRCAERMYEAGVDVEAKTQDGKFIKSMKWSDIRIDENQLTLLPYPVNALGSTPASKLDRLFELSDRGWIDQRFAKMLADLPDIAGWANLENAPLEFILQVVEEAMYDGIKPDPPDGYSLPYIPDLYLPIAIQAIHRAQLDGAPEENVQLIRNYVDQMEALVKGPEASTEDAPPPEAMPPLGPEGMPMTPENTGPMPPEGMPPEAMGQMPNQMPPEMPQGAM